MAEPKLLLTDEEYKEIKVRAARQGVRPQDLMRDAVRAAMTSGAPLISTSAERVPAVLGFLNQIAAKRPNIAKDLERLITHIAQECQDIAPDPIAEADAAIDRAHRVVGETGGNPRRKKGA